MSDVSQENNSTEDLLFPPTPNTILRKSFHEVLLMLSLANMQLDTLDVNVQAESGANANIQSHLHEAMVWISSANINLNNVLNESIFSGSIAKASVYHYLNDALIMISHAFAETRSVLNHGQHSERLYKVLRLLSYAYRSIQIVLDQFLNQELSSTPLENESL